MRRPRYEVADVLRRHAPAYLASFPDTLSRDQRRVWRDLVTCRTAAQGGHKRVCDLCGHEVFQYRSCRNRHCPKCQATARARWLADRAKDLLPCGYFHVVFTLPDDLGPLALQNKRVVYGLLFRAASETLLEVGRDPRHLGARLGFLAILHTWTQTLRHHPHLHCLVPEGGLSEDGSRWISSRKPGRKKPFLLPVRVLSRVFRRKFLALLREAFSRRKLSFHGDLHELARPELFRQFLEPLAKVDWVVYAKPSFGSSLLVLKYLARYTHRVAIANHRLLHVDDSVVRFRYKDYARKHVQRTMTLDALEFIRRFLLHVLPLGFVRIRHYGLFANRVRRQNVATCRKLLVALDPVNTAPEFDEPETTSVDPPICPVCEKGSMILEEKLPPVPCSTIEIIEPSLCDSS